MIRVIRDSDIISVCLLQLHQAELSFRSQRKLLAWNRNREVYDECQLACSLLARRMASSLSLLPVCWMVVAVYMDRDSDSTAGCMDRDTVGVDKVGMVADIVAEGPFGITAAGTTADTVVDTVDVHTDSTGSRTAADCRYCRGGV